jgi:hypothetical protein
VEDRDSPYREADSCHLRWKREIYLIGEQTAVTIIREEIYVIGKQTAVTMVEEEIYIIGKQTAVYRQLLLRSLPY